MGPLFLEGEKTRVVEGPGSLEQLGTIVRELGGTRALVVSDPGVVQAGHAGRALASVAGAGVVPELFAEVSEDPTSEDVVRGHAAALTLQPDVLVAVGGGSAIDVAKGINFVLCCGGRMQDYWGPATATADLLPLVAVPTTAGTGSEVQSFALIVDPKTHRKMACGDPQAAPRVALLDAELTLTQPAHVTLHTGLDALGHALESAVCTARSDVSLAYSRDATALAVGALPRVLDDPADIAPREDMLRAAALAGFAIEHSMLGAAHALANPLSAELALAHGLAVGLVLPHVIEFNSAEPSARATYDELARIAGLLEGGTGDGTTALAQFLRALLARAGVAEGLASHGLTTARLSALATLADDQWTARFNPRPMDAALFEELLARAIDSD